MLKFIAAAVIAAFAGSAQATDVYITSTLRSYHSDRSSNYNEDNPGLGVEFSSGDFRYALATYKNSFKIQSDLVAVAWLPIKIGPTNTGAFVGAVTGYPQYRGNPGLFGAIVTEYVSGNFGVNFLLIPPVKTKDASTCGVFSFQLKYKV